MEKKRITDRSRIPHPDSSPASSRGRGKPTRQIYRLHSEEQRAGSERPSASGRKLSRVGRRRVDEGQRAAEEQKTIAALTRSLRFSPTTPVVLPETSEGPGFPEGHQNIRVNKVTLGTVQGPKAPREWRYKPTHRGPREFTGGEDDIGDVVQGGQDVKIVEGQEEDPEVGRLKKRLAEELELAKQFGPGHKKVSEITREQLGRAQKEAGYPEGAGVPEVSVKENKDISGHPEE